MPESRRVHSAAIVLALCAMLLPSSPVPAAEAPVISFDGLEFSSWQEYVVTATVVFTEIWVFRWIVLRLPVLREAHQLPHPRPAELVERPARVA